MILNRLIFVLLMLYIVIIVINEVALPKSLRPVGFSWY